MGKKLIKSDADQLAEIKDHFKAEQEAETEYAKKSLEYTEWKKNISKENIERAKEVETLRLDLIKLRENRPL